MKKSMSILMVSLIAVGMFGLSCKKVKTKDLRYSNMSANNCYQVYVKKQGGETVLWFQVFDNVEDEAVLNSYKSVADKIEKYPAKIYKDKWIWLLVNNRMEIRLIADDKAKDFQSTEQLTNFIKLFDLSGMEKVTGPKLKPQELEKFIPKIGE